jgi:hypothetical protein
MNVLHASRRGRSEGRCSSRRERARGAIFIARSASGLRYQRKWGWGPMARRAAIGDCVGMIDRGSARPPNPVALKYNADGSAEPGPDVTDPAEVALRERDEVDDSSVASFPASDPPSWWSGR